MLQKKIDFGKRLIEQVVKNYPADKLQLANSGGKDSLVIYTLAKDVGLSMPVIHTNTTIDPDGTLHYIRQFMPETIILQPKETFYKLIERKGLPTRLNRYCCDYLKEYVSIGKISIEGVRADESSKRAGRDYIQCDSRKNQKEAQHVYPIYDWTTEDVYAFIRQRGLELAPCYEKGMCRLGCVGCPQVSRKGAREKEFALYPKRLPIIAKSITKGMELHPTWKLSRYTDGDGQKAIDWWLSNKTMKEYFGYDIPLIRQKSKQ